ncbi:MAG: ATP phosphoribosyltransferase, partial [Clostridia bacterium]|nr:ATP phosphoribosyltransferase [Clostridia bacterium]
MMNIALPKGRLGEKVYSLLSRVGYTCKEFTPDSRKLIFKDQTGEVNYFWVKPSDVSVYVELGAADVGVAGKDIIDEYSPDVYELADLNMGKCAMCVASKDDFKDDVTSPLRFETKFLSNAE